MKIDIKKIKKVLKKAPEILAEKALLFFLLLFLLDLIFGAFVFYKYDFLTKRKKPEVFEKPLKFQENLFERILEILKEKEKRHEETEIKSYPDPFRTKQLTGFEELTQ